jgi:hypothetical protein
VNSPAQDGSGAGVFGQFYAASGLPVGGEFQVNTSVGGNQQFPAADAYDGGTVVVWQSAGTDGDDAGVYGQRYDAGGAAVGGEFLVNQTVSGAQRRPDVAVGPDGAFIVCWEGEVLTFEVFCRRYDAAGSPVAGEFQVNTITSNHQQLAVVERDDAGNFTVAWQAAGNHDGSGVGVYRRRFGSNGAALEGADVLVNQFTTGDQSGPVIAMNGDGAVVIAWSSDLQDGSSTEVYARRYAANGGAAGAEFRANTTIAGAQNNPAVALNSAGDFVIVWQTADDGALTGVFAQRYDGAGATVSTEFLVNPTIAGLQEQPDVALRGASEIVAVWSAGDSGFTNRDIMLQRYDAQFP